MKATYIPFESTGYFSKIMVDYLNQRKIMKPFYGNFSNLEGFENQIKHRYESNFFSKSSRKVLMDALQKQYTNVKTTTKTHKNIELLQKENTFTITTGHQLNLFTGPLYFLYKIISAINICEELSAKFPKENFVPIYWMATEDHDFDEINYFNFKEKKIQWNSNQTGAVGRFSTNGLEDTFEMFSSCLNTSKNADKLRELFSEAYFKHTNLTDATRYIANELFGEYGLVIIDADTANLKRLFIPYIEKELLEKTSFQQVTKTIEELSKNYKVQVNPREINLFYIVDGVRERIIFENNVFKINNAEIIWSKHEILEHLHEMPERFSPNVIMRPLYQEVILPNLCYIGGGGELAYWLQLKGYFDKVEVPFPILLLRNSVQVVSEKQTKKLVKLNISLKDIFLKQDELIKRKVIENSLTKVDFSSQVQFLEHQFLKLRRFAEQTDKSFIGAVSAQEKKQLKGLRNLEKRWLRAEKRNQQDRVTRITKLQNELLPNKSLEERQRNFSEFYIEYGDGFIKALKENLKPLQLEFAILTF